MSLWLWRGIFCKILAPSVSWLMNKNESVQGLSQNISQTTINSSGIKGEKGKYEAGNRGTSRCRTTTILQGKTLSSYNFILHFTGVAKFSNTTKTCFECKFGYIFCLPGQPGNSMWTVMRRLMNVKMSVKRLDWNCVPSLWKQSRRNRIHQTIYSKLIIGLICSIQ